MSDLPGQPIGSVQAGTLGEWQRRFGQWRPSDDGLDDDGGTDHLPGSGVTPAFLEKYHAYMTGGFTEALHRRHGCSEADPVDIFKENFPLLLEELERWQKRSTAS